MNTQPDFRSATLMDAEPVTTVGSNEEQAGRAVPVLVRLWVVVLRRRYVILPIVALFLVAGLVTTLLMTPKFTATSRLEISRNKQNVTDVSDRREDDRSTDIFFYQTQYALLRARSLAERVATRLKLVDSDRFFNAYDMRRAGTTMLSDGEVVRYTPAQKQAQFRQVVSTLLGNVDVAPVRDSALVDVKFTNPDPELASQIANTWAEQFIQSNLDQRFESTADARAFLEQRLNQLRQRLEQSERDLVGYAASQQIITLPSSEGSDGKTRTDRTLTADNLEALNRALSTAVADRIVAETRMRQVGTGSGTQQANTTLSALRQTRAEVAGEYQKALAQFRPEYPQARALASQLASLERDINAEEGRIGGGVRREFQEALQREQQLRAQVEQLKASFIDQRRSSIQYNIFQREVDTNRQLYESLLQRYKEIGVAGVGTNNVTIVDRAQIPSAPSSPNLPLNLALALLLGLIVASAVTLALEQIDERISDPGEVGRQVGLPLLGTAPLAHSGTPFEDLADKKSHLSEAYFSTATSLSFTTAHGVPRSLIVTSTQSGEGKSVTSSAIAVMLARMGKSVILIDGDMRSASLHEYFGASNEAGLSNYLAGDDAVVSLVRPTDFDGLSLIAAGPMPPNAAELFGSGRMRQLITTLGKSYDHVIVDMPPVLGLADSPLVASMVEGVLFVIASGMSRARIINAAIARLRGVRANLIGVVFTKFNASLSHLNYGYEYGYGNADKGSK